MAPITKTQGRDFNYFNKTNVTWSTYGGGTDGYSPDLIIPFSTQGILFLNEAATGNVLEISFNGNTTHDELDPALSRGVSYDNRVVCFVWFRIKTGGPITVSTRAWARS